MRLGAGRGGNIRGVQGEIDTIQTSSYSITYYPIIHHIP